MPWAAVCLGIPQALNSQSNRRAIPETACDVQVRRYMPWAAGSRNCLGMPQAQVTMQATLATLLSRFSFRLAERVRPSTQGLAFLFQTWTPAHLLMRCS